MKGLSKVILVGLLRGKELGFMETPVKNTTLIMIEARAGILMEAHIRLLELIRQMHKAKQFTAVCS